ncbi:hypothetical protein PC116_g26998, partial [Phytophthora cactorum]
MLSAVGVSIVALTSKESGMAEHHNEAFALIQPAKQKQVAGDTKASHERMRR